MLHIKLKGITKCSKMKANILPANPPLPFDPRGWLKRSFFTEHGHIEYEFDVNHKMQQHSSIFPRRPPHQRPEGMWSKGQTSTFSEHGHVAYQINGNHKMKQHRSKYPPPSDPPPSTTLEDGVKGSNSKLSERGHVAYQRIIDGSGLIRLFF